MAENNEEKLLAVACHIAKTLSHNNNMANDILQIFSNFDGRYFREKLSDKVAYDDPKDHTALDLTLKSLDHQISQYVSSDHPIWADVVDSATYLEDINKLIATLAEWSPVVADKTVHACLV